MTYHDFFHDICRQLFHDLNFIITSHFWKFLKVRPPNSVQQKLVSTKLCAIHIV